MKNNNRKYIYVMKISGVPYRYIVKVTVGKVRNYVGCYVTEKEAIIARDKYIRRANNGRV